MSILEKIEGISLIAGNDSDFLNRSYPVLLDVLDTGGLSEEIMVDAAFFVVSINCCRQSSKGISKMLEDMPKEKECTFLFPSGYVQDAWLGLADKNIWKIYTYPKETKVMEIYHMLSELCFLQKEEELTMENLFLAIINGDFEHQGAAVVRAQKLGVNLEENNAVLIVFSHEEIPVESWDEFYARVKESVYRELEHKILITHIEQDLVFLYPYDQIKAERILDTVEKVVVRMHLALSMYAGVGQPSAFVSKIQDSFFQARRACKLGIYLKRTRRVQYFGKMGLYNLFFYTKDKEILRKFYKEQLGSLEDYDLQNGSDLVETLETYLENNCNSQLTANALFIHRNTLRYRLERISNVLKEDLDDRLIDTELITAFMIKRYLVSVERADAEIDKG